MSEHAIHPNQPVANAETEETAAEERADYKMGVDVALILGGTAIVFLAVILWYAFSL
ncbi:MAG TPA: hypothetical protein VFL82_04570 [Thermomicrobiales bacterium]|nr:hypothetical protein [Thermomicrobiales bacterium]